MRKTITISLPHNLSQAEARERLQAGVKQLHANHIAKVSHFEETWTGDHMDFKLHAMGQHMAGRLDIHPQEVRLEVDLPWMLALLAGRMTKEVEAEGRRMLERK